MATYTDPKTGLEVVIDEEEMKKHDISSETLSRFTGATIVGFYESKIVMYISGISYTITDRPPPRTNVGSIITEWIDPDFSKLIFPKCPKFYIHLNRYDNENIMQMKITGVEILNEGSGGTSINSESRTERFLTWTAEKIEPWERYKK